MISESLPSVLHHPRGSISMERALKQIKELLEGIPTDTVEEGLADRVNASIDDVDTMLERILR